MLEWRVKNCFYLLFGIFKMLLKVLNGNKPRFLLILLPLLASTLFN